MKKCTRCKKDLPFSSFHKDKSREDGLFSACRDCANSNRDQNRVKRNNQEYYILHREELQKKSLKHYVSISDSSELKKRVRNQNLRIKRGITAIDFERILLSQDGKCAICETDTPNGRGNFHVDHDHKTGQLRGLLCHNCNVGLGNFKDSIAILKKAINYLCL